MKKIDKDTLKLAQERSRISKKFKSKSRRLKMQREKANSLGMKWAASIRINKPNHKTSLKTRKPACKARWLQLKLAFNFQRESHSLRNQNM